MKPWFKKTKKGTVTSLIEKRQREDFKRFKDEEKRRKKKEEEAAKKKQKYYGLRLPKRRKQKKTLSRKSRIGLI